MGKNEFKIKPMFPYLAAFFLPVLLLLVCYMIIGVFPFGDKTLLTGDLSGQYSAFLAYFKEIITHKANPYYTFSKVIGGEMVGFGAYYIYSPFNFLLLLFNTETLPNGILLVTLAKIGTCSAFMYYYLKHRTITYSHKWIPLIFSVCYSLMSYNISYQQNIMWLDSILLLPLIILGLEKLIESQKWLSYCLFLSMSLIFNYYTGYMICLFIVLYFLYYSIFYDHYQKLYVKMISTYILASLLSVGISAIVTLPTAFSLQGGKASFNLKDIFNFTSNMSLKQFLTSLLPGTYTGNNPNVYCGTLILLLTILFFISNKIKLKQKTGKICFFLIMISSMFFVGPDRLWHATAVPAGFPYRYSFLISFLLIQTAFEYFCTYKLHQLYKFSWIRICAAIFCFIELTLNATITLHDFDYESYSEHKEKASFIQNTILTIQKNDTTFYRIENHQKHCLNDAMHFNYNGLSSYSSSEQSKTKEFAGKMGLNDRGFWVFYPDEMPNSIDSFLNIKYVIQNDSTIITNKNVLPLGILANEDLYAVEMYKEKSIVDVFQIQNQLWNSFVTEKNTIFDQISTEELLRKENTLEYQFVVERESKIYTNIHNDMIDHMEIYQNGNLLKEISSEKQVYSLGTFSIGDTIRVKINSRQNINWYDLFFYYENVNEVDKRAEQIRGNSYNLEEYNTNYIKGKITNPKDKLQYLLFTIPYDQGWEIIVDGLKIDGIIALDCLISVPISPGEHEVILHYFPKGLKMGFIISLISLTLLVLFAFYYKKHQYKHISTNIKFQNQKLQ